MIEDHQVPWWAFSLVHFDKGTPESRVKNHVLNGYRPHKSIEWAESWNNTFDEIVERLFTVASRDPEEWPAQIDRAVLQNPEYRQKMALKSGPRAFVQWIQLKDDSGVQLVLKDFHVRTINALRRFPMVAIFLPFMHGKSEMTSKMIPLMDWCENVESTQLRVYQNEESCKDWTRVLMHLVENHEPMHRIFPGVSRPGKGNINQKIWSTDGFNIAGRELVSKDPSFRTSTWSKGRVGVRTDRAIADDLVTDKNDESVAEQKAIYQYLQSSLFTTRNLRPWKSEYGTLWGTVGISGTIYNKQDAGARIKKEWEGRKDRKVIRIDVFPYKNAEEDGVVIWPEVRPFEYIQGLKQDLGVRAFRMRLRNIPDGDDAIVGFDEEDYNAAVDTAWEWGKLPSGAPCVIGFDPGSGKTTRYAKNPAYVLLAFTQAAIHFVSWGRWRGKLFPQQISELATLAKEYHCPVMVEDNNQQVHYAEQMTVSYPGVRVMCMTTGENKRDPQFGVEAWEPIFRNRKVIIHAGHAPKDEMLALKKEFMDWPRGDTSDLVMASWFARHQYELMTKRSHSNIQSEVPGHLAGLGVGRGHVDISRFKTQNKGASTWASL